MHYFAKYQLHWFNVVDQLRSILYLSLMETIDRWTFRHVDRRTSGHSDERTDNKTKRRTDRQRQNNL